MTSWTADASSSRKVNSSRRTLRLVAFTVFIDFDEPQEDATHNGLLGGGHADIDGFCVLGERLTDTANCLVGSCCQTGSVAPQVELFERVLQERE